MVLLYVVGLTIKILSYVAPNFMDLLLYFGVSSRNNS